MLTQAGHEGRVLIRGLRCCCNKQTARKFRKLVRNPARKEKDDWGETRGSTWYGWGWGFEIPLGELDQRDPRHLLVRLEGPNSLASSSPLAGLEKTSSPPTERKGRRRGVRRGVGSTGGRPEGVSRSGFSWTKSRLRLSQKKTACASIKKKSRLRSSGKVTYGKFFSPIFACYKLLDMRFLRSLCLVIKVS